MRKEIRAAMAPQPAGPYSQGIQVGNRVYVAGQGPFNVETGTTPDGITEQTRQTLKNVQFILQAAGASMDDVVKATVHLQDLNDFAQFNEVYKEFFTEPYPVRTTVESGLNKILVEIDVIAEIEEPSPSGRDGQ